ncbi:hypothetical protein [Streptomyces sp. NPDC004788]
MADERYAWLDKEAAERLLRGEAVDPGDQAARDQARLLARALESARTATAPALGPDGELPGEAAALAAFRKASAERAGAAATAPGHSGYADLGAVRLAPAAEGRRWGRSLRYGLAAAFAAVTVGGVAVAAGTGVLPLTHEPGPGSSVDAGNITDPSVSASISGGTGSEVPGVPTTGPDGRTTTPGPTDGPDATTAGTGGDTATPGGGTGDPVTGDAAERDRIVRACQDYRAGKLADSGRQRLTEALKSGDTVKRYCDRVLSGVPVNTTTLPTTGRTTSGSANGGSGDGSGKGSGTDKGSGSGSDSGNGDSDGDGKSDRGDRDRDRGSGGSAGSVGSAGSAGSGGGHGRGAGQDKGAGKGHGKGSASSSTHGRNGSRS